SLHVTHREWPRPRTPPGDSGDQPTRTGLGSDASHRGSDVLPPPSEIDMTASRQGTKLISVDELGTSGVAVVKGTPHGDLAVGMSNGAPFAIANRCRHLFGPLGKGTVDAAGKLVCPRHHAEYDV